VTVARKIRRTDAARPAPFTPDQVAALIAGEADQDTIARVLNTHRQPRLPGPAAKGKHRAASKLAPIAMTAAELRALAIGITPPTIAAQLEAGASKRRPRAVKRRKTAVRPTRRPPV
jgi:hypothetical protein